MSSLKSFVGDRYQACSIVSQSQRLMESYGTFDAWKGSSFIDATGATKALLFGTEKVVNINDISFHEFDGCYMMYQY